MREDCGEKWDTQEEFIERFAELIVKECARVIDRGDGEMSSMAETIWCNVCRDDILKHFGVKEWRKARRQAGGLWYCY